MKSRSLCVYFGTKLYSDYFFCLCLWVCRSFWLMKQWRFLVYFFTNTANKNTASINTVQRREIQKEEEEEEEKAFEYFYILIPCHCWLALNTLYSMVLIVCVVCQIWLFLLTLFYCSNFWTWACTLPQEKERKKHQEQQKEKINKNAAMNNKRISLTRRSGNQLWLGGKTIVESGTFYFILYCSCYL